MMETLLLPCSLAQVGHWFANYIPLLALHDEFTGTFLDIFWQKITIDHWAMIGFGGQAIFFSRWIVQWIISEKAGKSEIPIAFWWISITGGCITFVYAVAKVEPVLLLGQLLALAMYTRNLFLVFKERARKPSS